LQIASTNQPFAGSKKLLEIGREAITVGSALG
jgi:hypothetical protein